MTKGRRKKDEKRQERKREGAREKKDVHERKK